MARNQITLNLKRFGNFFTAQESALQRSYNKVEGLRNAYMDNYQVSKYALEFKERLKNFRDSKGFSQAKSFGSLALKTTQAPIVKYLKTKSRFFSGETEKKQLTLEIGSLFNESNNTHNNKLSNLCINFHKAYHKANANSLKNISSSNFIALKEKLAFVKSSQEITKQRIMEVKGKLNSINGSSSINDKLTEELEVLNKNLIYLEGQKTDCFESITDDLIKKSEDYLTSQKNTKDKLEEKKRKIEQEQKKSGFFKKLFLASSKTSVEKALNKISEDEKINGKLEDRINDIQQDKTVLSEKGKEEFFKAIETKPSFASIINHELGKLGYKKNSDGNFFDALNFFDPLGKGLKNKINDLDDFKRSIDKNAEILRKNFKKLYRESSLISSLETQVKKLANATNTKEYENEEKKVAVLLFDIKHPDMTKDKIFNDMQQINTELREKGEKPKFEGIDLEKLYSDSRQLKLVVSYKMMKLKQENLPSSVENGTLDISPVPDKGSEVLTLSKRLKKVGGEETYAVER
jgi:hypothetical protein